MSCNIDIDLKLNIHDAALIRAAMFQYTKQDSYEFPSQRTIEIREAIVILDEEISKKVSETSKEDS